jgi:hypothetical protein
MWELNEQGSPTWIGKRLAKTFGSETGFLANRMLHIYGELLNGKFKTSEELHERFKSDGLPLFTSEQSANIFKKIQPHQTGGGILTDTINDMVKLIPFEGIGPYIFYVNTLENTSVFKDAIGAALDITAGALPVMASFTQSLMQTLVGAIPIPFSGPVGIFIGYMFASVFLWTAILLGITRREFGAAVEATAGLIPVFGQTAMRAVSAADRVGTKLNARKDKIIAQLTNAYGSVSSAAKDGIGSLPTSVPKLTSPAPLSVLGQTGKGLKQFTRRRGYTSIWKVHRKKSRKHSGGGLR